jgi:hypothetical protein
MFLQLKKVSDEMDMPRVYITTNTHEMVGIYRYKTKIVVDIHHNKLDDVPPDENGKRPMIRETFKIDKKNKFFDVLKWIETKVSIEVNI